MTDNETPGAEGGEAMGAAEAARAATKAAKQGNARRRQAWRETMRGQPDRAALADALARLEAAEAAPRRGRRGSGPLAAPSNTAAGRWVPIGPSVVRRGQAAGRPRVTGRINDLAVSANGLRAYAASGNGGLWYTDDAGSTWCPVGGWVMRGRVAGGRVSALTVGCVEVVFGADAAHDLVLVGTGDVAAYAGFAGATTGGIGMLSAVGPVTLSATHDDPWEPDVNTLASFEGARIYRIVHDPATDPGETTGARRHRVIVCSSIGLFIGVRQAVPAAGGFPARGTYQWTPCALAFAVPPAPAGWPATPVWTDALWLPGGRLVLAVDTFGLVTSDNAGMTIAPVPTLSQPGTAIDGRLSLARAAGNRIYTLYASGGAGVVEQIPDATLSPPVSAVVNGVPAVFGRGQADYDQCIAVDRAPVPAAQDLDGTADSTVDRLYLGGDTLLPTGVPEWVGSVWVVDVQAALTVVPAPGISTVGAPPLGVGATDAGLVGNTIHPDVHTIRLTGPAANRTVWVGCDGGIFVSTAGGRVHSFAPRVSGLSTVEAGFLASHPLSGHYLGLGVQDNGVLVRTGDSVWEEVYRGDGGGVAFHPTRHHVLVGQWTGGAWQGNDASFIDPLHRNPLNPNWGTITGDREFKLSAFYSGAAAIARGAGGRVAVGTNRIWLTDDLGGVGPCTWRVLPVNTSATGASSGDRRTAAGADINVAATTRGVPSGRTPVTKFGAVHTTKWVSDTELLAAFKNGIVRWRQLPSGNWVDKRWSLRASSVLIPRDQTITDLAPVPGTHDFYLTTIGTLGNDTETVWWYSSTDDRFRRTGLRRILPGPLGVLGPLDPAYAVVVDPGHVDQVYVGTATGVWHGTRRDDAGRHDWVFFDNGLPQAGVQDLAIWVDPTVPPLPAAPPPIANRPRLLRAAVQSRGVWEVDLLTDARRRTYLRVHSHDDRRTLPTPMTDPRQAPTVALPSHSSPDIVIRPRVPVAAPPVWPGGPINVGNNPNPYQLWQFQTALRWHHPNIVPTGQWIDPLGDIVAFERNRLALPPGQFIDRVLWDPIVGTRLAPDFTVAPGPVGSFAVCRPAWSTPTVPTLPAGEVDLMECVVPPGFSGANWSVYSEPSTVDVLLHHRDSRTVAAGDAWGVLMWRFAPTLADGLTAPVAGVVDLHTRAWTSAAQGGPTPAGWTVARLPDGSARHPLTVPLDARTPRAISIDVDLTPPALPAVAPVAVVFLALVGSFNDDVEPPNNPILPIAPLPVTVDQLVRQWPYAACRVVALGPRPTVPAVP